MTDFAGRNLGSPEAEGFFISPHPETDYTQPGVREASVWKLDEDGIPVKVIPEVEMTVTDDRTDPYTPEQLGELLSDPEALAIVPRNENGKLRLPETIEHVTARPPLKIISQSEAARLVGPLGIEKPEVRAEAARRAHTSQRAGYMATSRIVHL